MTPNIEQLFPYHSCQFVLKCILFSQLCLNTIQRFQPFFMMSQADKSMLYSTLLQNSFSFHQIKSPGNRGCLFVSVQGNYIIPIPPMPPISGAAGASAFGNSVTIASVVIIREPTDAANCSAERVTLVGSRIPISSISP